MGARGLSLGWRILAAACVLLALYSGFVIFNVWVLVPDNPGVSQHQNLMTRVWISVGSLAIGIGAAYLARWSFRKIRS